MDARENRIADLRRRIADGTYRVSSVTLAREILNRGDLRPTLGGTEPASCPSLVARAQMRRRPRAGERSLIPTPIEHLHALT